jgi:hypothetical protein
MLCRKGHRFRIITAREAHANEREPRGPGCSECPRTFATERSPAGGFDVRTRRRCRRNDVGLDALRSFTTTAVLEASVSRPSVLDPPAGHRAHADGR